MIQTLTKAFGSMYQVVMTKKKSFVTKDWIVKKLVEYGIKIFEY